MWWMAFLVGIFALLTSPVGARQKLTSNLLLTVDNVIGVNDATCGTTTPCRTVQRAMQRVCYDYDLNGLSVRIATTPTQTYMENLIPCNFIGHAASYGYGQVVVDFTGSYLSASTFGILGVTNNVPWVFKNVTFINCPIACVEGDSGGLIALDGPTFKTVTGNHIISIYDSRIIILNTSNPYTIAGGAGVHWYNAFNGAIIVRPNMNINVTGNPHFKHFFAFASKGSSYINALGTKWNGAATAPVGMATGTKFHAEDGATISTGGMGSEFFPGTENSCNPISVCVANGGQYH